MQLQIYFFRYSSYYEDNIIIPDSINSKMFSVRNDLRTYLSRNYILVVLLLPICYYTRQAANRSHLLLLQVLCRQMAQNLLGFSNREQSSFIEIRWNKQEVNVRRQMALDRQQAAVSSNQLVLLSDPKTITLSLSSFEKSQY